MKPKTVTLRNSLSYQQTKVAVIVAFSIGVVLSSVQIYIDYFSEQAQTRESVNNALATADNFAFHAAFNIDESAALQITRGLVSNRPIIRASIIDDFGEVLGTAENNTNAITPAAYAWIFGPPETISRELKNSSIHDEVVGELSIVVDPSLTAESFMQRSIVVFMAGFVRNIILAVFILAVFYVIFTRSILQASQPIMRGKDKMHIAMPERHADDEIGVLIGAFNEHISIIEEQKQQIVEANENLESLVNTRTEQLNERNRELEVERSLAIEASMAKSEFLAMMSHEIRTPMSGILGMAELLANRCQDAQQKDYADAIIESSKSLLTLMNSVLDYSKYERGQMPFESVSFDPVRLVQSIIFLLSASAESKQIVLNSEIDTDVPRAVLGDSEKLRQVLLNLITNAIKFTENGRVIVKVQRVKITEPPEHPLQLKFSVIDNGIGVDQHAIEEIFQPYTQADSSISRRFGGTGMGLAICKEIVEQQGGSIVCESPTSINEAGEAIGSKFFFELPFELSSQEESAVEAPLAEIRLPSVNVLVVDDLAINRKLAQGQLENEGHKAHLAASGLEALEALEKHDIDVVLMDLHMPELDGIETTHRIRQGRHIDLPIIGLTANVSEQKVEECLAAGMNLVIFKPVDQAKLVRALGQVLRKNVAANDPGPNQQALDDVDTDLAAQHLDALGDSKFVELYREAMGSAEQRIAKLAQRALDDVAGIRDDAHALAGLCANFGFMRLANISEAIELDANQNKVDDFPAKLERLQDGKDSCFNALHRAYPILS